MDEDTGGVLDVCGTYCATRVGMQQLVGQGECSLPGCVQMSMVHPRKKHEMGYCCEDHRLRATQRSLVSWRGLRGVKGKVCVNVCVRVRSYV